MTPWTSDAIVYNTTRHDTRILKTTGGPHDMMRNRRGLLHHRVSSELDEIADTVDSQERQRRGKKIGYIAMPRREEGRGRGEAR